MVLAERSPWGTCAPAACLQFLTVGRLIGNAWRLWSRSGPLKGELRAAAALA